MDAHTATIEEIGLLMGRGHAEDKMPSLYIIGAANGSGKTTVSMSLLPKFLDCFKYVNADAIAAGLSPLNPE
ncbi:hypothetical protein [uncultured Nostoc sp.]|uniref:hypothetical protein n=1 Tax=uncultured Nostoc sp. TaxID=340711 RepID=UPI0035CA5CEA